MRVSGCRLPPSNPLAEALMLVAQLAGTFLMQDLGTPYYYNSSSLLGHGHQVHKLKKNTSTYHTKTLEKALEGRRFRTLRRTATASFSES